MGEAVSQPVSGKAVVYPARGGYDLIRVVERVVRAPAAGEVRIRVRAAAVNATDIVVRDSGRGVNLAAVPFLLAAGAMVAALALRRRTSSPSPS